jgi:hypothetical protein
MADSRGYYQPSAIGYKPVEEDQCPGEGPILKRKRNSMSE